MHQVRPCPVWCLPAACLALGARSAAGAAVVERNTTIDGRVESDVTAVRGANPDPPTVLDLYSPSPSPVPATIRSASLTPQATAPQPAATHGRLGTVTIPAGQTSRTFTVAVAGDRLAEPSEWFAVNLSAPTNVTISDGQAIGTILDDEPRISIGDVSRLEGKNARTTLFTFTATLSSAYDQPVTASFRTADGTARLSDRDYVAKAGTITFNPGETSKTITIDVRGDNRREANEAFYLDLFDASSNALFVRSRGMATILNDD